MSGSVGTWFATALATTLAVGLALALIAGVLLVLAPERALAFAARLNREYSVGWLQRLLDAPRTTEPWIYRSHRTVGSVLVIATAYFFLRLADGLSAETIALLFGRLGPEPVIDVLAWTAFVVLLAGNAIGLLIGVVVFVRPSALKSAEDWANRWIASDRATAVLDRSDDRAEGLVHRYPRRVGAVVIAASLYVAVIGWVIF